MELDNQANENSPVIPLENGSATQEVSSTTQAVEPTKRSLRVQTWRKIQDNKCGIGYNVIFNRIPAFVDSDKAAALLAETEEFKKSENIKVSIDRALNAVKHETLLAGKVLYLPGTRDSSALYLRVDVPADATEEQKKEILNIQDVHQHRTEITLDSKIKLDMVIIGSVVVSREGHRIGRGNGFADLDIGLLIEVGAITPDTVIATVVHDLQVVDSLPIGLFQKYDTPIDLIVTPKEVIRVANRLPRPTGLFWELLSERRLKIVPVLQVLKEVQEKSGKIITLKAEDTDVEQNQNNRNRRAGFIKRRYGGRRNPRRAASQTDTEQQGRENAQQKRTPRRNRRYVKKSRRPTKSEGDQSAAEGKSQERKPASVKKQQRPRKPRSTNDFCIKLSNISREVRVKDLKTELRKRECNPFYISWKGQFGKCYLHFGQRNGNPSTDDDINNVLQLLNDLSITVPNGANVSGAEGDGDASSVQQTKTITLNVELIKFDDNVINTAGPVTKRSLRSKTWKKFQDRKAIKDRKHVFNVIPSFENSDKANALVAQTCEFKDAQNIAAYHVASLHEVQLEALLAGKSLYSYSRNLPNAALLRLNVPEDATDEQKKEILLNKDGTEVYTEVPPENKTVLDIVFIGSVLVSRDGYRIGSRDDSTNLDMGLLIEIGAITADTVIATVVDDVQVVETLPEDLFQKYDIPVDLIVTPTEVIRANRRPRPIGIYWELLSERDLKKHPFLETYKEAQEKAGARISLKASPADEEQTKVVKVDGEPVETSTV